MRFLETWDEGTKKEDPRFLEAKLGFLSQERWIFSIKPNMGILQSWAL
jgi:hypothetical protein